MRKLLVAVGLVAVLAVPMVGAAATLSNGSGQSCGSSIGIWHFVNNQTGGAAAGTLTATFSNPTAVVTVGPTKVNSKVQHFDVTASGTLVTAETNLPGRLVLSDFTCGHHKK